ncbi:MAG: hypothetical protein KDA25_01855, partial [Phycisphaerales bacterium]|nr:hypothetical protein [Phycisphaerales bacterium]
MTDATHDPSLLSWVESANADDADFPIQNLPFGVFSRTGDDERRIGVAIGDQVLDVRAAVEARLIDDITPENACSLCAPELNEFMALGRFAWTSTRRALSAMLARDTPTLRDDATRRKELLVPRAEVDLHVPACIGDYTDFYASIHHATNVGSMFRPDNPLLP